MEHYFTENSEINFGKLESRLINSKYSIYDLELIQSIGRENVLVVATGGSKVVANYLKMFLERKNVIVEVIEPRDYFYKSNVLAFKECVIISYSFNSNGLRLIFDDFVGKKYLITGSDVGYLEGIIRWEVLDREKSFISIANSLVPMKMILQSYLGIDNESMNFLVKEIMEEVNRSFNSLSYDFSQVNLLQVIYGYENYVSMTALESSIIESGACALVSHEISSYFHGRSNLLYQNPNSPLILFQSDRSESFNFLYKVLAEKYSRNMIVYHNKYNDDLLNEFRLCVEMYYLVRKISEDKGISLTQPDYDVRLVKKLYNYRGGM